MSSTGLDFGVEQSNNTDMETPQAEWVAETETTEDKTYSRGIADLELSEEAGVALNNDDKNKELPNESPFPQSRPQPIESLKMLEGGDSTSSHEAQTNSENAPSTTTETDAAICGDSQTTITTTATIDLQQTKDSDAPRTDNESRSSEHKENEENNDEANLLSIPKSSKTNDALTMTPVEERAIRFLNHPAIRDLTATQKWRFLEEQCGLTKQEIDQASAFIAAANKATSSSDASDLPNHQASGGSDDTKKRMDQALFDSSFSIAPEKHSSYTPSSGISGVLRSAPIHEQRLQTNMPHMQGTNRVYNYNPPQQGTEMNNIIMHARPPHYPPSSNYPLAPTQPYYPHQQQPSAAYSQQVPPNFSPYQANPYPYEPSSMPPPVENAPWTSQNSPSQQHRLPPPYSDDPLYSQPQMQMPLEASGPPPAPPPAPASFLAQEDMRVVSLTATALIGGGLGVVGMAAWRWINGGDFELIPPPRIIDLAESDERDEDNNGRLNNPGNNHVSGQQAKKTQDGLSPNLNNTNGNNNDTVVLRDDHDDNQGQHDDPERLVASSISELARAVLDLKTSQEQRERKRESVSSTNNAMQFLRSSSSSKTKTSSTSEPIPEEKAGQITNTKVDNNVRDLEVLDQLHALSNNLSSWATDSGGKDERAISLIQAEIQKVTELLSNVTKEREAQPDGASTLEESSLANGNGGDAGIGAQEKKEDTIGSTSKPGTTETTGVMEAAKDDSASNEQEAQCAVTVEATPLLSEQLDRALPSGFAASHMRKGSYTIPEEGIAQLMADDVGIKSDGADDSSAKNNAINGVTSLQQADLLSCQVQPPGGTSEASTLTSNDENRIVEAIQEFEQKNVDVDTADILLQSAVSMINVYISNIVKHPSVKRYRKVNTHNQGYKSHIVSVPGARELLSILGFASIGTSLEWKPKEEHLLGNDIEILRMASNELKLLKQRIQQQKQQAQPLTSGDETGPGKNMGATDREITTGRRTHKRRVTPIHPVNPQLSDLPATPCHPTGLVSPPVTSKKATVSSGMNGSAPSSTIAANHS
jgi:hypothetical protein